MFSLFEMLHSITFCFFVCINLLPSLIRILNILYSGNVLNLHPLLYRPPRLMGEGFVVMQSNDVDIYYYMDEPGITFDNMLHRCNSLSYLGYNISNGICD